MDNTIQIPSDAIIPVEKLTKYLLVPRQWDDKSRFLQRAGFNLENWMELRDAIRQLTDIKKAIKDAENEYGIFYLVEGPLVGPLAAIPVTLVWMQRSIDKKYYFVTLKPCKRSEL